MAKKGRQFVNDISLAYKIDLMSNSSDTPKVNSSDTPSAIDGVVYGEVDVQPVKKLPEAAVRALAEAEERRATADATPQVPAATAFHGQHGPEPTP